MRRLLQLSTEANGFAAAGLVAPFVARSSSLEIGAGLLQATLAAALHIIPPLIPPKAHAFVVPLDVDHGCWHRYGLRIAEETATAPSVASPRADDRRYGPG